MAEEKPRLHDLLERVDDRASFFASVEALIADREDEVEKEKLSPSNSEVGTNGWVNDSIEGFLECALAWAESTDMGVTQGLQEEPSWKAFAAFLYCGKIYE